MLPASFRLLSIVIHRHLIVRTTWLPLSYNRNKSHSSRYFEPVLVSNDSKYVLHCSLLSYLYITSTWKLSPLRQNPWTCRSMADGLVTTKHTARPPTKWTSVVERTCSVRCLLSVNSQGCQDVDYSLQGGEIWWFMNWKNSEGSAREMIDYVDVRLEELRKLTKVRSYDSNETWKELLLPSRSLECYRYANLLAPLYHTGDWVSVTCTRVPAGGFLRGNSDGFCHKQSVFGSRGGHAVSRGTRS